MANCEAKNAIKQGKKREKGQMVPISRVYGVGVPAPGVLRPESSLEAPERHELGTHHELGRLAFSQIDHFSQIAGPCSRWGHNIC